MYGSEKPLSIQTDTMTLRRRGCKLSQRRGKGNFMQSNEVELFIHGQAAKPKVILAAPTEALRDVLIRAEFIKDGEDILVFVGECEDALHEPDDIENGSDRHEPVDASRTIEALGIRQHHHIHCHRCHRVAVEVNFNAGTKHRKFSPATTVGVVAHWARNKFHLDSKIATEYVLQLCESTDRPRPDTHLGEFVSAPRCSLCFDLVKEITPQG